MQYYPHGGGCCGVKHISGFYDGPKELITARWHRRMRALTRLKRLIKEIGIVRGNRGKVIEIILTDPQIADYPDWPAELKALDFKLVTRFRNSTGSVCNIFHKTTGICRDEEIPEWWR